MQVVGAPRMWLRLEGGAVLVTSLVAYHWQLGSWWTFALLILAPDLSMVAYAAGPSLGARAYNLVHNYVGPLFLAVYGMSIGRSDVVPYALIWTAHIGVDRLFGFGLKYGDAFSNTHLSTHTHASHR